MKIISPTLSGFSLTLNYQSTFKSRQIFVERYSENLAQYIDHKLTEYFRKLISISNEDTKHIIKQYKIAISDFVYSTIISSSEKLDNLKKIPDVLKTSINLLLINQTLFADLIIIALGNDYETAKRFHFLQANENYIELGHNLYGHLPEKINIEMYGKVYLLYDVQKPDNNFRKCCFKIASDYGYNQIEEQKKFYRRFIKHKTKNNLKDFKSFKKYFKILPESYKIILKKY